MTLVNNLNQTTPFPGDLPAALDNVGDLRHLFHRLCLHLVQLATAIRPLEGEREMILKMIVWGTIVDCTLQHI